MNTGAIARRFAGAYANRFHGQMHGCARGRERPSGSPSGRPWRKPRGVAHAPARSALRLIRANRGGTTRRPSVGIGESAAHTTLRGDHHLQPSSSSAASKARSSSRSGNLSETKGGRQFTFGVLSPLLSPTSSRQLTAGGVVGFFSRERPSVVRPDHRARGHHRSPHYGTDMRHFRCGTTRLVRDGTRAPSSASSTSV